MKKRDDWIVRSDTYRIYAGFKILQIVDWSTIFLNNNHNDNLHGRERLFYRWKDFFEFVVTKFWRSLFNFFNSSQYPFWCFFKLWGKYRIGLSLYKYAKREVLNIFSKNHQTPGFWYVSIQALNKTFIFYMLRSPAPDMEDTSL